MNTIALIDVATFIPVAAAAAAMTWRYRQSCAGRQIRPLILGLVAYSALYYAALGVEWIWASALFDTLENFLGAIYPMWWMLIFYAMVREISDFDLEKSKERYRFVVENQSELVAKLDPGKRIDYVSPSFRAIFGRSEAELVARPFCKVIFSDDARPGRDFIEDTLTPPYSTVFESSVDTSGGIRWFDWSVNRLENAGDGNEGFLAVGRDVTERKRAEARLIDSEQQHRRFIENLPVGMFRSDSGGKGRFVMANTAMARMLGYEAPGDLLEVTLESIYSNVADRRLLLAELSAKGHVSDYEVVWKKRNGSPFIGALTMNLVRDEDDAPMMVDGIIKDVTRQKEAEAALIKSERLHREAQKIAGIGHWELDLSTNRFSWSEEVFRITNIDKNEFDGRLESIRKNIHPDDLQALDDAYTKSLAQGAPFDVVYRRITPEGHIKYIHSIGHFHYDASHRPVKLTGTAQDITRLKEAEAEKASAEKKLRQAQKLESIGTLAGGIAHDFNNILTPIIGFTEMALNQIPENDRAARMLREVLQAGMRARDLVSHILAFSRETEQELAPVDIGVILKEAVRLLRATIPSSIEIRQSIDKAGGRVLADPVQIHQIVMNLGTNAYHAIGNHNGTIDFTLRRIEIGEEGLSSYSRLSPGDYLHLEVRDTGRGIPKDIQDRIFDPYFSTKNRREGTGLGLAVVHGIVTQYRGHISVYSEPGQGAAFHIYLPSIEDDGRPAPVSADGAFRSGDEHIMVVDDEAPIGQLFEAILTSRGYRVSTFTDSREAVACFEADPDAIDLVFTDMTMPAMSGEALSKRVLALRPDIPVFICSGYGETLDNESTRGAGVRGVIRKPVLMADIARCLKTAFGD